MQSARNGIRDSDFLLKRIGGDACAGGIGNSGPVEPDEERRADYNGPQGNCEGDGTVNVLDIIKIVNLIVRRDECPGANSVDLGADQTKARL